MSIRKKLGLRLEHKTLTEMVSFKVMTFNLAQNGQMDSDWTLRLNNLRLN